MNNFASAFEPNYIVLAFLMAKTFFYIELIAALSLVRAFAAKSAARSAALAAFTVAIAGVMAKYLPAILALTGTDIGAMAANYVNAGNGMALPLAASALLFLSAGLPGRRWWGLDALHMLIFAAFVGLWIMTW